MANDSPQGLKVWWPSTVMMLGTVLAYFDRLILALLAPMILRDTHMSAADYTRPFFDPLTFNTTAVMGGTSIAVLAYIGFDGISTLSEEVENPRRNIYLATVWTCVVIGLLSAVEVYVAQLIWPASQPFPDVDTAFVHVAGRAAGLWFSAVMNLTLLIANFGSGMGAQIGRAHV